MPLTETGSSIKFIFAAYDGNILFTRQPIKTILHFF